MEFAGYLRMAPAHAGKPHPGSVDQRLRLPRRAWLALAVSVFALHSAVAPEVHAVPCAVPLAEFGPVDRVHGFPEYYQDSNGLALQACLDFVCDPALPVPNPNLPISFPDNFPVEVFYFRAISTITAGPVRALLNDQLEGSFANGNVAIPGDQIVFSRVRVRIFGASPGGTYTVTHPYGVEVVRADGVGTVNFTTGP